MTILLEDINPIGYDAAIWLWLLVLGSTLSFLKEDHDWFISKIAQYISVIGYGTWNEVIGNHVQNILWINGILVPELESLRVEVPRLCGTLIGRNSAKNFTCISLMGLVIWVDMISKSNTTKNQGKD